MSIWKYMFDSEYQQRSDIEALKQASVGSVRSTTRRSAQTNQRVDALEEKVGELALICRSLLTHLRETGAIEPEAFEAVMRRIDAEDGVVDGKVTPEEAPKQRPKRRPVSRVRRKR